MFGLPAFPKLVLIVVVIAAVWYFFRRTQVTRRQGDDQVRGGGTAPAQKNAKPVEDMVQCPSCGAYVPAGTKCNCGKS